MARQPIVGQVLRLVSDSWSCLDTPHSVGFLWTSDQPDAEISTWQHTTLRRDRHPCHRRATNPQSQQASGCRPVHWIACSLGSAGLLQIDIYDYFLPSSILILQTAVTLILCSCLLRTIRTPNQELHMQPHLPWFYHNNTLRYCIWSF